MHCWYEIYIIHSPSSLLYLLKHNELFFSFFLPSSSLFLLLLPRFLSGLKNFVFVQNRNVRISEMSEMLVYFSLKLKHHSWTHTREREIIFQTRNTSLFKTFDYAAVLGFSWAPWQITFHWKIQKINDRVAKVTPVPFAFRSGRKIVLVLQLAALGE